MELKLWDGRFPHMSCSLQVLRRIATGFRSLKTNVLLIFSHLPSQSAGIIQQYQIMNLPLFQRGLWCSVYNDGAVWSNQTTKCFPIAFWLDGQQCSPWRSVTFSLQLWQAHRCFSAFLWWWMLALANMNKAQQTQGESMAMNNLFLHGKMLLQANEYRSSITVLE